MDSKQLMLAIEKTLELQVFSARLARKCFERKQQSSFEAISDIEKAYGGVSAIGMLVKQQGMEDAHDAWDLIVASLADIVAIHRDVLNQSGRGEQ